VGQLATQLATLKNPATNKALGWQGDQSDPNKGLRVTIIGFRCADDQTKPISILIGKDIGSQADLNATLTAAKDITPDGGTCPHKAIDQAVYMVQTDDLLERPVKSAVMVRFVLVAGSLTRRWRADYRWCLVRRSLVSFICLPLSHELTGALPVCRSQESALGFNHFCVSKFALGLPGGEHGTSLVVTKQQEQQLEAFVAPNKAGLFNFGKAGFTVLSDIAVAMAQKIPFLPATQTCLDAVKVAPYWCVRLLFFVSVARHLM